MKVALIPLREILKQDISLVTIKEAFGEFRCQRDADVISFLNKYSIENEAIGASRSYLALSQDQLEESGKLELVAFFTLAITVTDFTDVSNRYKRKIMGNYPRLSKETRFPGFLLGQLARNDKYKKADFDCSNLLGFAEKIVSKTAEQVGGNLLYLDCKEPLVRYYENHGYTELSRVGNSSYIKMFKCLPRIDLLQS